MNATTCAVCIRLKALVRDPTKADLKRCGKCRSAQRAKEEGFLRRERRKALEEAIHTDPEALNASNPDDWSEELLHQALALHPHAKLAQQILDKLHGSCFETNLSMERREALRSFLRSFRTSKPLTIKPDPISMPLTRPERIPWIQDSCGRIVVFPFTNIYE